MWQSLFWKAGFFALTWPMLLSELLLMPFFWVRSNVDPQKSIYEWRHPPPDPRLAQMVRHSALPRVSVCQRIGDSTPRLSLGLTSRFLRCSKSCCGGARNTESGLKVEYSCLRRTTLAPGEGLLDYSNVPKEIERSVVPHATYAYHTHGTTLRSVQLYLIPPKQDVIP